MKRANWLGVIGAGFVGIAVIVFVIRDIKAADEGQGANGAQAASSQVKNEKQESPTTASSHSGRNGSLASSLNSAESSAYDESLRGKVTNKYRVRDDILKYIDQNYKDEKTRAAFINYAAAQQDFIEYGGTRAGAIQAGDKLMVKAACVFKLIGVDRADELKSVTAMTVDTEERFRAYWKAVDLHAGRIIDAPKGDSCE
ncbi:hypothetical protein [Burkholderia sp. 3C]